MLYVVYYLILKTVVFRCTNGEQIELVANRHLSKWEDAFVSCKNQSLWKKLLNNCKPETCNASAVADKIINRSNLGRQQYWINGYVLRSPVIVNKGCFSLKASKHNTHRGKFSLQYNSAFECAMACPSTSVGYIFLKGTECLCIPTILFDKYSEESTDDCTMHCQGSNGDLCGFVSSVVGEELYSAYEIVNRNDSRRMKLGNTCTSVHWDDAYQQNRFNYTRCSTMLIYVCQIYNKTSQEYDDDCNSETASWYDARQKCHNKSLTLTSNIKNRCPQTQHWIGNHVAEKIVWGNVSLPQNALCLKLVIHGSDVTLETENCVNDLYSLCYTSRERGSTEATIKTSPISTGRTTLRGPVNAESDSDDDKPNLIPIIAGSVGGFVALVIVVIIVCIIQRRKKTNRKNLNTAVDQTEPETYSEPIKNTVPEESRKLVVENTIPEENLKLVNVTEEGIYNHLGDSEKMIEMKPQDSSIYDVTGDDEYHVFTGTEKQTIKDDDDLYDHGAASDVYNTLNDTVTPNRPESDTYNVINAK